MILGVTLLCVANYVLHYQDIHANYHIQGEVRSFSELFLETVHTFPASFVVALFAVLFSFFVFTLCGFHSFIVSINLTTQEKLSHKYDRFPRSPFSFGRCFKDWSRVICWTRRRM